MNVSLGGILCAVIVVILLFLRTVIFAVIINIIVMTLVLLELGSSVARTIKRRKGNGDCQKNSDKVKL